MPGFVCLPLSAIFWHQPSPQTATFTKTLRVKMFYSPKLFELQKKGSLLPFSKKQKMNRFSRLTFCSPHARQQPSFIAKECNGRDANLGPLFVLIRSQSAALPLMSRYLLHRLSFNFMSKCFVLLWYDHAYLSLRNLPNHFVHLDFLRESS